MFAAQGGWLDLLLGELEATSGLQAPYTLVLEPRGVREDVVHVDASLEVQRQTQKQWWKAVQEEKWWSEKQKWWSADHDREQPGQTEQPPEQQPEEEQPEQQPEQQPEEQPQEEKEEQRGPLTVSGLTERGQRFVSRPARGMVRAPLRHALFSLWPTSAVAARAQDFYTLWLARAQPAFDDDTGQWCAHTLLPFAFMSVATHV